VLRPAAAVVTDIHAATHEDFPGVLDLLHRSGLPADGLSEHTPAVLVAYADGRLVGSAALERYGDDALLRSVAVDPIIRGSGVGKRLTEAVLAVAREWGVRDVFLLTTTAEDFFPRFGFARIDRAAVPEPVRQSVEFATACPASAVVFRKHITAAR
jgi:amino-acid N-acetyltransferase